MINLEIDLANFLAAHGFGVIGQTIFYSQFVEYTDDLIIIISTSTIRSIEAGVVEVMIHIHIRNRTYSVGEGIAKDISALLHDKTDLFSFLSGALTKVGYSKVRSSPIHSGRDGQRRHLFYVPVEMIVKDPF